MSLTCTGLILSAFHSAGHPFFLLFLFSFGAGTWTGLRDVPTPRIPPLWRQVLGQLYNFPFSVILESDVKPVFRGSYWTIRQVREVPRKQEWTFHTRPRFLTDAREPRGDQQNGRDVSPVWKTGGLLGKSNVSWGYFLSLGSKNLPVQCVFCREWIRDNEANEPSGPLLAFS